MGFSYFFVIIFIMDISAVNKLELIATLKAEAGLTKTESIDPVKLLCQ